MTQYLVTVTQPDGEDAGPEDPRIGRDVGALNDELLAAGALIFGGGLEPSTTATTLHLQVNGDVILTDGPFLETKEQIGGFWVVEAPNLDAALDWGKKAAAACRVPIEVRPFGGVVEI